MSESCSYNCSAPPQPPFFPDNDIIGIGVIINYIATAGIAVFIILIYYLTAYEPTNDPFERDGQSEIPFFPNPVDYHLLGWIRNGSRYISKRFLGPHRLNPRVSARLENTFIKVWLVLTPSKCVLAMSDLQIVTGFSILISGFARIECGLAAYEWLFIVNLAWFSCLTHLSCLTILRNHLYDRALERLWRLFAMGSLATLLVVGLLSMGNVWWGEEMFSTPGDYAICHLGFSRSPAYPLDYPFWTMLVSSLVIVIGFVSRVVKLHKTLSINLFGKAKLWINICMRKMLRPIFNWCCEHDYLQGLRRSFVYRPLLSLFLGIQFILDGWASLIFEIGWLFVAFIWGIWRVYMHLQYPKDRFEHDTVIFSVDRGDWTFGKIVSVTLLAAPLITIIEYFDHDVKNEKRTASTVFDETTSCGPQIIHYPIASSINTQTNDIEDPGNDWYHHPTFPKTVITYCFVTCIMLSTFIVYNSEEHLSPLEGLRYRYLNIAWAFAGLCGVILFSLFIESVVSEEKHRLRILLQLVNMFFFSSSTIAGAYFWWVCIPAGLYILCACGYKVLA